MPTEGSTPPSSLSDATNTCVFFQAQDHILSYPGKLPAYTGWVSSPSSASMAPTNNSITYYIDQILPALELDLGEFCLTWIFSLLSEDNFYCLITLKF